MKALIKLNGWIRLFIWKVCPECNSDAPKKDHCIVCQNKRDWQFKESVAVVWHRYKNQDSLIEKEYQERMSSFRASVNRNRQNPGTYA